MGQPQASGKAKGTVLTVLLGVIAVVGPMVAYAGVSVIYPSTTVTADVDETPPITFAAGADHAQAVSIGFATSISTANNAGSFTISVNGLSGGNVTVDDLVTITKAATVTSFKFNIATAYSGSLDPTKFGVRFWTGGTAPTTDTSSGVCAVMDLELNQETVNSCTGTTVKMQVIMTLPTGQTTESGTVSIRPSSVVFA